MLSMPIVKEINVAERCKYCESMCSLVKKGMWTVLKFRQIHCSQSIYNCQSVQRKLMGSMRILGKFLEGKNLTHRSQCMENADL